MKKVLLVEDHLLLRMSITFMLSHEDTAAISCDSLECAEEALLNHAFDLLITDLKLSSTGDGMEGMRLLEMVKKNECRHSGVRFGRNRKECLPPWSISLFRKTF